ncbi:MAG: ATP-binding cassette domain-containing protein [Candidatus Angelobacter sp.]
MERLFQLTGPNGCGKTSALRLIGEFPQVMSSAFQLPQFTEPPVRTSAVGFQAGQNVVFSRSVRSLLSVPLVFAGLPIRQANARLESLLEQFNFGYLLNRDYLTLSGGERQFVALFSCLLSEVDLYLLDDPVVMMDQERAAKTLTVINDFLAARSSRCAIASVRPIDYATLHIGDVVHLGYSPNVHECLEAFGDLLASLDGISRHSSTIVLENVTISPFGTTLLRNESQRFHSGEILLIGGANGTGKTCLLHALGGISRPHSGSVAFLDAEQKQQMPAVGKNCVYLPQQFFNLLGFETVSEELGTAAAPRWWRQVLEFLYDWRVLHPGLRVPESSLGERHFCNILAALSALARNPALAVLLLDEPDSGLDELHCGLLTRVFHWFATQNCVVAIVSHRTHLYYGNGSMNVCIREFTVTDQRLVPRTAGTR